MHVSHWCSFALENFECIKFKFILITPSNYTTTFFQTSFLISSHQAKNNFIYAGKKKKTILQLEPYVYSSLKL